MTFSFSDIQNNPNQVLIDPVIPATAPGDGQGFLGRYSKPFKEGLSSARETVSNVKNVVDEKTAEYIKNNPELMKHLSNQRLIYGALPGGVGVGVDQLLKGQTLGAAASVPGAVIGSSLASRVAGSIPLKGTAGTILRGGARLLGGLGGASVAANAAEEIKKAVTGQSIGKDQKPNVESPAYAPGTTIPLNDTTRMLELAKALSNQDIVKYKTMTGIDAGLSKDMLQFTLQQQLRYDQAQQPLISKYKNDEQIRTQALMNTAGNIDARLGMLATQGALAKGAQAEVGALARTMLSTNPYAQFAVNQSPNINFG